MEQEEKSEILFESIVVGDSSSLSGDNAKSEDVEQSEIFAEIEGSEVEQEVEEEEFDENEEDDSQDEGGEVDGDGEPVISGKNGSAILAEHYKTKGLLPSDFEVKDNLTSEELIKEFDKYALSSREDALREAGLDNETIQLAQYLASGGNPQLAHVQYTYQNISQMDLEDADEDTLREIVKYEKKERGLDDDDIESIINSAIIDDRLSDLAKKSQSYFGNKSKEIIENDKKRIAEEKIQRDKSVAENEEKIKSVIRSKKFGNINLSDKEAKQFENDFFTATELVTDNNGKNIRVSKYRKRLMEIEKDPEKTLEFVYMVLNGSSKIKEKVKDAVNEDILSVLDNKTVARNKPKLKKRPWIGPI